MDKYNSMTAVCPTDLKSSRAHGIPLKVPGESAAAKQTKRLKVDPKDENIVMHRNHYTFSLLTLDEQLKPSSQAVMFDFDWPVNILDKDNNVVRSKTQEYTVQTQANGEGKIYFRLYQRTRGRVGIRLEGVFERLIKTVEYV